MHLREFEDIVTNNIGKLGLKYKYTNGDRPYTVIELNNLRPVIDELSKIDFIKGQIDFLEKSWLYSKYVDEMPLTADEYISVKNTIDDLKIGLEYVVDYLRKTNLSEDKNSILIKLPGIKNFDDLSKISNEFKKAIELPILDKSIAGEVSILSAERGSIWFTVGLATTAAVNLIGAICWSAAVIKRKWAEAKMFEAHAKTLDLKNENLQILIDAQKIQINNVLAYEAEAIAEKHYNANDPETIERLKLSITTTSDLIEKGAQILPSSKEENVKKMFPDYSSLSLIESTIKQIANS